MKYNVFHYLTFHIRIDDIEADSSADAIAKSAAAAFEAGHNAGDNWSDFEFAEEQTAALVDVAGDENYVWTEYFDADAVREAEENYHAKPCNEHT